VRAADVQSKSLTGEEARVSRNCAITQVLGTDMKKHFDILSRFQVFSIICQCSGCSRLNALLMSVILFSAECSQLKFITHQVCHRVHNKPSTRSVPRLHSTAECAVQSAAERTARTCSNGKWWGAGCCTHDKPTG